MSRAYPKKPEKVVAEARQKMVAYFEEAEKAFPDKKMADKFVAKARKIAMKVKLRVPPAYKRKFCKHCYSYLKPNENCRVRIRDSKVIYSCFHCKKFMRFPLK